MYVTPLRKHKQKQTKFGKTITIKKFETKNHNNVHSCVGLKEYKEKCYLIKRHCQNILGLINLYVPIV